MLKWDTMIEFDMDQVEDGLRLQMDDFRRDNIKLSEALKTGREEREQLGFELDDAQNKIRQLQYVIGQYEEASLR